MVIERVLRSFIGILSSSQVLLLVNFQWPELLVTFGTAAAHCRGRTAMPSTVAAESI